MKKNEPNRAIEQAMREVAGTDIMPLIKALGTKKPVSEYKLAENINQEVNQTRTMLYKLHQANLVSCIKKKDAKKGWYVYYWSLRREKIVQLANEHQSINMRSKALALEEQNTPTKFQCNQGCTKVSLEDAMEIEFRCPECGELMGINQSGKRVLELESTIPISRKPLKLVRMRK